MPGVTNKSLTGYFETEYASEWPGLVTNLPSSRIPPGAATSCNATVVRGRLQNQPGIFPVTGTGGLPVTIPSFGAGENICAFAELQVPGSQQGFSVFITNVGVYTDFATPKTFVQVYSFPVPFPRYARFGTQIISNILYFSSGSQRGVYALTPQFSIASIQVTNPGGYFTSTPTVVISDGAGTGATATATVSGMNLTGVTVTSGGSGYISTPVVSFNGGNTSGTGAPPIPASAVGILSASPTGYIVREVSAFTGVASVTVTAGGSGYYNPSVEFIGGGGTGATGTAIRAQGGNAIVAVQIDSFGQNYTSPPTIQFTDTGGSGLSGGTGATATATLFEGTPYIGGDFMATMNQRLLLDNIIGGDGNMTFPVARVILTGGGTGYTSVPLISFEGGGGAGAAAYANETGGIVTSIVETNTGSGYYQTPSVLIDTSPGVTATAIAQLGSIPLLNSSDTRYPDRSAWSGPNAYGYFDPNYLTAPGGYDTITEARGLITSINVVESVAFIGHNGGITEMTPNTSSAAVPFAFYPIWSADQGIIVRYGSMAQYGSTLAFLANDSAYSLTPSGVSEIGGNIANLLRDMSIWNNGSFPLQGLYGSIVEIEGQKHYLITFSSDDWDFLHGNSARKTIVYDLNMSENCWHFWEYDGTTATCAIYQAFDQAVYSGANSSKEIAKDAWLLMSGTTSSTPEPPSGPVFLMNPTNFDLSIPFNFVAKNTTSTYVLPIFNEGGSNLTITAVSVTTLTGNAGDFVLNGFSGTITISDGAENTSLSVSFTPTSAFETLETATLSFTTNAGTKNYTLKGTSVSPGSTSGPYTPTPTSLSVSASQSSPGSNTQSATMTFAAQTVLPGQTVNVSVSLHGNGSSYSGASPGESYQANYNYSIDGGSTYTSFYEYGGPPDGYYSDTLTVPVTGLLNLSNLVLQVKCVATCPSYEQTAEVTGFISSASASIAEPGDIYCEVIELDPLGNHVPPALQFGTVTPGDTYVSNEIALTNPTSSPVTVSLAPDTANGYSIINQVGSNTLAPNNGSNFTFNVQLTNPSAGTHNDTSAVAITIPSQVGPILIDAWYGTSSSESSSVVELAPVSRNLMLTSLGVTGQDFPLAYQFRSEAPSIARLQEERRILVEYENQPILAALSENPTLSLTYTGQQDPTSQTGTVSQQQTSTQVLPQIDANTIPGQILTVQADFGTFTGVCTSLSVATEEPVSIVRLTQIADLPKGQVP
jgi:hypothetical protein